MGLSAGRTEMRTAKTLKHTTWSERARVWRSTSSYVGAFYFFLFFFFVARLVNLLLIYENAEELPVLIFGDLGNDEVVLSEQKSVRIVRLDFVWQH